MAKEIKGQIWKGKCTAMAIDPYYGGEMMKMWKQLKELVPSTVSSMVDLDKYFRYLALCFDPHSPLVKEVEELKRRRNMAKKEVGFVGEGDVLIEINFLKFTRSRLWQLISVNEILFDSHMEQLLTPISGDTEEEKLKCAEKQGKLRVEMAKINEDITKYRRQMFEGDVVLDEAATVMPVDAESMVRWNKANRVEE